MAIVVGIRRRLWGLLVGGGMTLLAVLLYLSGALGWLERGYLDFNFRHCNHIDADPRIVMIDINDLALQQIARWPWPRRLQAELVDVLNECRAQAIVLDLVYAEPMTPRLESPLLAADPDAEDAPRVITDPSDTTGGRDVPIDLAIHDDDELADAIARAGNVYVAMYFQTDPPGYDSAEVRAAARRLLDDHPDAGEAEFLAVVDPQAQPHQARALYVQARMDQALRRDFGLSEAELANRLDLPLETVRLHLARVKEIAARHLVARHLANQPDASLREICRRLLPGTPDDAESPDRRHLERARLHVLAARQLEQDTPPMPDGLSGMIPNSSRVTLPLHKIARAAHRTGFVSFEKDPDGIVRHVPILANVEGRLAPQLGFALAVDLLDIDLSTARPDHNGRLLLTDRAAEHLWRVPLDAAGAMLLNWHVSPQRPTWDGSFEHIPVAFVMEVAIQRRAIAENNTRLALHLAHAVELMYGDAQGAYVAYAAQVRERNTLRTRQMRQPLSPDESARLADLNEAIARIERTALAHLQRLRDEIRGLKPRDEDERRDFDRIRLHHEVLIEDNYPEYSARLNAELAQRIDERLSELRHRLDGKLCFVGHTAAAQADMVNTPVYESMPGVLAHANLVNTFLQNRIPRVAAPAANVAFIVAAGLLITILATWRGPWEAFLSVVLVIVLSLAVCSWVVWEYANVYVAASVPATSAFVTWALITLYRQLTEMRYRRSLARELARNTSPAIAARITEQIEAFELTPQPADVTCYFSDLQGFTNISERLGVARTTAILNRYLAAMGEVLIEYRAFNKFMGDGIFAFFNAPIWPVADHAVTGCEAALQTLDRLEVLKAQADPAEAAELRKLWMRIGLHTGPVFVGYFGSENQSDYTCIGDTVNLAARLESANKAFGTQILVSGACREQAGDRFVYRNLGALRVLGRDQAAPVFELLGRAGSVPPAVQAYADRFSAAVTSFQKRSWDQAGADFQACAEDRPADRAATLYLEETARLRECPPGDEWNQAIELSTK